MAQHPSVPSARRNRSNRCSCFDDGGWTTAHTCRWPVSQKHIDFSSSIPCLYLLLRGCNSYMNLSALELDTAYWRGDWKWYPRGDKVRFVYMTVHRVYSQLHFTGMVTDRVQLQVKRQNFFERAQHIHRMPDRTAHCRCQRDNNYDALAQKWCANSSTFAFVMLNQWFVLW